MDTDNIERVLKELRNLDGFEAISAQSSDVQRLGGLTNLVYRVKSGERAVIVRITGSPSRMITSARPRKRSVARRSLLRAGSSGVVLR